jgi:hypothetical protein
MIWLDYHCGLPPGDNGMQGREGIPRMLFLPPFFLRGIRIEDKRHMTTVIVNSGACGFTITIKAKKGKEKKIDLSLDTACEMVQKMLADIATVDHRVTLIGFRDNPIYLSAAKHLKHVACPVPSAILKAIETETGMNVPKDARIEFVREE